MDRVRYAGMAVAIVPDTDAHGLEKFVRAHEGRVDLNRHRLLGACRRVLPHLDRSAGRGLMRNHWMAGVGLVLDQHFPIAVVHVAQHAARDLELSDRRAVDHVVEARERLAEEFLELRPRIVQLAEDEAAIVVHVPDGRHAACAMAPGKTRAVVATLQGNGRQAAVEAESPGVVGTAEEAANIATSLAGQPRALVRTAIVENLHALRRVAHHDDGLLADRSGVVVADLRYLAVVADIDP